MFVLKQFTLIYVLFSAPSTRTLPSFFIHPRSVLWFTYILHSFLYYSISFYSALGPCPSIQPKATTFFPSLHLYFFHTHPPFSLSLFLPYPSSSHPYLLSLSLTPFLFSCPSFPFFSPACPLSPPLCPFNLPSFLLSPLLSPPPSSSHTPSYIFSSSFLLS